MEELNIFTRILNQFGHYINQLDWGYIFTFMIMAYASNKINTKNKIWKWVPKYMSVKWWPVIVGLLYACALFFVRDHTFIQGEMLFKSFVFAVAFQHTILEKFFSLLENNNSHQNKDTGKGTK
ncbi:hypothetical protein [Aquimarina sp. RZ0]|uniref:hypothetical protein n=1 Tax=Aquimarina sp. RZ0 TaxID=2607730 RepID=UPI0011F1A57F|nr:hypothetical protein [Aquimarina sp. RZ0]KAA1247913.1 hypothetical protein F0000_01455 [Aquimarina sp. RZ0]